MGDRFVQKRISLTNESTSGKLKISKLLEILEGHPYLTQVKTHFDVESIKDKFISIEYIDVVFYRIKLLKESFYRFQIYADSKDVSLYRSENAIEDINEDLPLVFHFQKYIDENGVEGENLESYSIYGSKNTFLDEYEITKYANRLYKHGLDGLAEYNLNFFKNLAEDNPKFNRRKSYRLVQNGNELFLRGITSIGKYHEYGVDFAFVIAMLILYHDMKQNPGNNYEISSVAVSESKLELIVVDKNIKNVPEFGSVSSAITISTNDLGQGSLNFAKIINIKGRNKGGIYLFPETEEAKRNKLVITHSMSIDKVLDNIQNVYVLLNNSDEYIKDLNEIKTVKTPDELRSRIFNKLIHPRSVFKNVQVVQDIFKRQIENEISSFAKLLEMCNKAEELDIDYDLKDKLRYIISDIILNRKKGD